MLDVIAATTSYLCHYWGHPLWKRNSRYLFLGRAIFLVNLYIVNTHKMIHYNTSTISVVNRYMVNTHCDRHSRGVLEAEPTDSFQSSNKHSEDLVCLYYVVDCFESWRRSSNNNLVCLYLDNITYMIFRGTKWRPMICASLPKTDK